MALSKCKECGKDVSDKAISCPHCGAPLPSLSEGQIDNRELRKRGVSVREAWNTSKSAHGPWRLSKTPALNLALPAKLFRQMGLPALAPAKAA